MVCCKTHIKRVGVERQNREMGRECARKMVWERVFNIVILADGQSCLLGTCKQIRTKIVPYIECVGYGMVHYKELWKPQMIGVDGTTHDPNQVEIQ